MSELKHLKMWHGILKKNQKKTKSPVALRDEPKPNNWISPLHFRSGPIHFACVYDIIISGTKLWLWAQTPHPPAFCLKTNGKQVGQPITIQLC